MKIKKNKGGMVKKFAIGGIIAGSAQAALGIGQAIYGAHQAKKAKGEMNKLLSEAPKLELPSAYRQYAEKAANKAALRAQTDAINARLASSTQALSQAGGRALIGGLNSQVTQANQAGIQAQDAQLQREMQGLQVLGGAQNQLAGAKEQRFQMQYGAADQARNAGLANIGGGLKSTASGVTIAGSSFDGMGGRGKKGSVGNPNWAAAMAKDGMKTKGEFSHDTNPITMTDKDGNVVGEATGGEYIVNPSQAKAISKESKYFRNLLKKKQFKS